MFGFILCKKDETSELNQLGFAFFIFAWQRLTLPGVFTPSTISAGGLNGRVRDGYVCIPSAIIARHLERCTLKTRSESYQQL
jgi:hypothetical protein